MRYGSYENHPRASRKTKAREGLQQMLEGDEKLKDLQEKLDDRQMDREIDK